MSNGLVAWFGVWKLRFVVRGVLPAACTVLLERELFRSIDHVLVHDVVALFALRAREVKLLPFPFFRHCMSFLGSLEPTGGIEPPTYSLPWSCSTSELRGRVGYGGGAGGRIRTYVATWAPDLQSGAIDRSATPAEHRELYTLCGSFPILGASGGIRTHDLRFTKPVLYH